MKKYILIIIAVLAASHASGQKIRHNIDAYVPMNEIRVSYSPFFYEYSAFANDEYSHNFSGSFSFSYTYRFNTWFEFGGTFGAGGLDGGETTVLAIGPTARFSWLRTDVVRLYSSISLTLPIILLSPYGNLSGLSYLALSLALNQISPLGITVGKKFFFMLEPFCIGGQGYFIIGGIGYRFPVKKS